MTNAPDPRFPFESPERYALRNLVNAIALTPGAYVDKVKEADRAARDVLESTYLAARGYVMRDESQYSNPFPFELYLQESQALANGVWRTLISKHRTREAWERAACAHDRTRMLGEFTALDAARKLESGK